MMANDAAAAATYTEAKINKWNNRGNKVLFFISSHTVATECLARLTSHEPSSAK